MCFKISFLKNIMDINNQKTMKIFSFKKLVSFSIIGVLNTSIDFLILNFLIFAFSLNEPWQYSLYKGVAFLVACINSYFLNAHFTFNVGTGGVRSFGLFFLVTTLGMILNVGTATIIFAFFNNTQFSAILVANGAALVATVLSMIWNYVFYHYIVFRK